MVELEAWGGVDLSAGEPVCPLEEVFSFAGSGHGDQEARDVDWVPGNDEEEVEEVGKLAFGGALGPFPQRSFCELLSPAVHLQHTTKSLKSSLWQFVTSATTEHILFTRHSLPLL